MKLKILTCVTAITLFAALLLPARCFAQRSQHKLPHYTVVDLGTLGGTFSEGNGLSFDSGWVAGNSTLPGDSYHHAYLWRNGVMTDLYTLGGPNSYADYRPNFWGDVGGQSETITPDPLDENWCGADYICLPFFWRNDIKKMIALPTLGGNNGLAAGVNFFRQVVGIAETAATDPTCPPYLQTLPVLWQNGRARKLPVFPGDPDGMANAINDWGQAVGYSGDCSSTLHALLWQNGKAIYLGSLGGTFRDNAEDINNLGQVVGYSGLPGDTTYHAFLWQRGVMTDLGTLSGDVASSAAGINNLGQVVGGSADASGNEHPFLWQNGVMTDLNTLIPADSGLYLVTAQGGIDDWGRIAGIALQISTGEEHAYLATPSDRGAVGEEATTATATERPKVTVPENVRKRLQRRARLGGPKGGAVTPQ